MTKRKHVEGMLGLGRIDTFMPPVQTSHCPFIVGCVGSGSELFNSLLVVAKLHLVTGHFLWMRIRKLNLNLQILECPMTIHHPHCS